MGTNKILLRPVEDADIALLTQWLNKEYILKWYEDADAWLKEINGRRGEFSWLHHFIVMDGDTPIGFCQYYDCFDAHDMEEWYDVKEQGQTYSIDYLIGNEAHLGNGFGKQIVASLTDMVAAIETAKYIVVQPEKDNHASNHVLLANGYLFDDEKDYFCKSLRREG